MKKLILPFALILLLFTASFAFAAESEPNNSRSSANTLALNGNNSGAVNPAGDEDWWKVTTNADGKLEVSLTLTPGSNYLYIYLYDNDGITLLNSGNSNSNFTVSYDGLAQGTYYIMVKAYYSTQTGDYAISNNLILPTQNNDQEPNGNYTLAKNFPEGSTRTGHVGYYYNNQRDTLDWYKITTSEDGLLQITITPGNSYYLYGYIYDNDGTTLLASANGNSTFTVSMDGLAKGTYLFRINCYYNSQFAPYTINNTLLPPAEANDEEPNDNLLNAKAIPLNSSVEGHVGYYYNNERDTADWYKMTTNKDGLIKLDFNPSNGKYIYGYLYDKDGTTLLASANGNNTFSVIKDGLAKGTYYVKVRCYYSSEFAPYTLSDSLKLYAANEDNVNNAFPYQAATLKANESNPGHVGFYYNNQRDLEDWWKINYTGTGNLSVSLKPEPHLENGVRAYTYLYIYDDTSASPIYSNYTNLSDLTANLTNINSGYLWVKIKTYYSTDFSAYTLTPTFNQTNIAQIGLVNSINGTNCNNGQLQFNIGGSKPPYSVQLYRFGAIYGSPIIVPNNGPFNVNNLLPGKYIARAYGDGATGNAYSTSSEAQLLPPSPTGLNTVNITNTKATITWTSVSCADGYYVQLRETGNPSWTSKILLGNKTNLKLNNLSPGTTYQWRVATGSGVSTSNYVLSSFANAEFTTDGVLMNNSQDEFVKSVDSKMEIKIFPNPAASYFKIKLNSTESNISLVLKDISGKTVWQVHNLSPDAVSNLIVNVSNFKSGIYILTVSGKSGYIKTEKVIVGK